MAKRDVAPADTALADFRESARLTRPPRTLSNAASRLVDLLDDYLRVLGIGWEIPPGFPADRFVPSVSLARDREGPIVQYLVDLGFSGDARRVHEAIQRCHAIRDCRIMMPSPGDDKGWQQFQKRYVNPLSYEVARLRSVIYETRQLIIDMGSKGSVDPAAGGDVTPLEASKPNQDTPTVPPAGHSGPSTDKAAQLRKIEAKVRQVAGACNEEGYWKGCIAIGPLFKEAYEAGAWQREGSQIGDRLKRVPADRQELWTDGRTPAWMLDAYFAVVEPLTSHLMPPTGEKEHLELEARIAADAIEEEAKRIEAGDGEATPKVETSTPQAEASANKFAYLDELVRIEKETPPLNTQNRQWITASEAAAKGEAKNVDSLKSMRRQGRQNRDITFGVDKAGRKWRKESGTQTVWYWVKTLVTANQVSKGNRHR